MFNNKLISRLFSIMLTGVMVLAVLINSAAYPTNARALGFLIVVTTTSENTNNDTVCSLREAITNANLNSTFYPDCGSGCADDTISFDNSLGTATITLGSALPAISDTAGLSINGGGDISISGNNLYRVFYINSGVPLILNNLTVTAANPIGSGGGIYNNGTLTVTNSTFSANSATFAGGIYNYGTLTVTNSTFSGNSAATELGGGIYNYDTSTMTVTNSTFSGNSANYGGGIYNSGTLTVTNSTFSGNIAGSSGGGVFNASTGTLNQYNVIIANSSGGDCVNSGTLTGYNNLIESTGSAACGLTNGLSGNIIGSDPNLGALTGSPAFFPLNAGSPAIDTGNDAICVAPPVSNTSQNGLTRPQGAHCDIGSYEFVDTTPPNTTIDSAPSDPGNDSTPTFTFSGDDGAGSGIASFMCQMDSGSYSACTTPFTSPALADGLHTFYVFAIDMFGNADASPASFPWQVDTSVPTVLSSLRADPSPTNLASVDFTVTFSESVTGVDTSDFSLTTTGVSGAAVSGVSGSGSVYTVSVNTGSGNGTIRLDVVNDGTIKDAALNPLGAGFTSGGMYTVIKSPTFVDVPFSYWAWSYIERLYSAGITGGCSITPLNYCPDSTVTRAQMAVFLLKGIHSSSYTPPAVGLDTGFTDVPVDYWAAAWIKQLAAEGITGGCGMGIYCPDATVTRAQMAVFLLKAKHGTSYSPPDASGVFTDVPVGYWADKWIEQLAVEGITGGCGVGIYCPDADVTRAQMAVFLVRTFNLP